MIHNIKISDYKTPLGGSSSNHNKYQNALPDILRASLLDLEVRNLELFNLTGDRHTHNSGHKNDRLVIFTNATAKTAVADVLILPEPLTINGVANTCNNFLPPNGDGIIILSEHGIPLAEWREETWELNIFFDLFKTWDATILKIFKFIMDEFNRLVWIPKTMENSWKFTQNKDALTSRFIKGITEIKKHEIEADRNQIRSWEGSLREYKIKIKSYSDNLAKKMRTVETEELNLANIAGSLVKDLDLIVAHEKITDLKVIDGKFVISTVPIIIRATNGDLYQGGEYRIEIEPENTRIRFFSPLQRRSYWTDHDPHPHVDGESGEACLGNIASTIAELCSQMQIYALVMIAIDFLENANTDDSAGRKVVNWDRILPDGSVETTPQLQCTRCEEPCDQLFTVYEEMYEDDDGYMQVEDSTEVCEACRNNHYGWNDRAEEYVRN